MQTFKEILGQATLINNLRQGVVRGQVHHAYLFHGSEGVGKKTTALALAAALNCLASEEGDACGKCSSCLRVASGNHPDLYRVMPQGKSIKIEQVRELQEVLSYKHWQGCYKVALIEEAERLTEEAANSLLKILEEPPEKTCFVLLTSRTQGLLPTILSRCQQYSFRPLSIDLIQKLLEEKGIANDQARLLARLSNGSLGRAITMVGDETFFQERQKAIRYCDELVRGGIKESLEVAEALNQEDDLDIPLELMGLWWRDLLVWQLSRKEKLLVNVDLYRDISQKLLGDESLRMALLELEKTRHRLGQNANRKLSLEVMALKINQEFTRGRKGGFR